MLFFLCTLVLFSFQSGLANHPNKYVSHEASPQSFALASYGSVTSLLISKNDYSGVIKVANHFSKDLMNVTGIAPKVQLVSNGFLSLNNSSDHLQVIIGTLGKSEQIDNLAQTGKIDQTQLEGKWEKFITQIVENPAPGIEKALVIAGSDKRGTIYGIYDLSEQIGVSPWYWWADVPIIEQNELHVLPGVHTNGEPKVKYRGIFINDEAPALSGWAYERFGAFNAEFYEHVFELILRLKGNYLWPAMWGRMFYVDDPENPVLADEYGVVIGTSHHEPLMRAHAEWQKANKGDWNYVTNAEKLETFWREGMERMGQNESIVTIGMRGDGDEPMTEGTAIELLENIVKKQREIITETTQKPIEETPQIWALYKEVQEYYDKGMRVPEDVTLLLCDDNWGNLRKLPDSQSVPRKGGYGIYYHYDYVGGPRNYKWLNTNQIERVWEQMHLAYDFGARKVWIVNVGDIKPMEFPTEFFLDYAWDPDAWNAENLAEYYSNWAAQNFGEKYADQIATIIKKYTKYNARRKPELLSPDSYSLDHYHEAQQIVSDFNSLAEETEKLYQKLPNAYKDAFYQLVWFPVKACANLNELYFSAALNKRYAQQGRSATNQMANKVEALFLKDSLLTVQFHQELSDGKWNHMMDQTHIGYTYWQQPESNNMPETTRIELPHKAKMAISINGSERFYESNTSAIKIPEISFFSNIPQGFEIFNRGEVPFNFEIEKKHRWINITGCENKVDKQVHCQVEVDWDQAPKGRNASEITLKRPGEIFKVAVSIFNPKDKTEIKGFVESNGYISFNGEDFAREVSTDSIKWITIPNLGKTGSAITPMPVNGSPQKITDQSPRLEYDFHAFSEVEVKLHAYFSPTINFSSGEGLKYGIALDEEVPQEINVHENDSDLTWSSSVANNIRITTSVHRIEKSGNHTLKFFMIDSGLDLQKIVIETQPLPQTYLGPPRSENFK